ncbi:MAG TPA: aspartyl protease family protein [Candidatus Aquilonibacter sp.]|nr:aspartyl protease family protein [Candidatus Aquilonibacter sp.]
MILLRTKRCPFLVTLPLLIAAPCGYPLGFAGAQQSGPPAQTTPAASGQSSASPAKTKTADASSLSASIPAAIPVSALAQAADLYRKGDFAGAIAKYQQWVQERPKSPDGYAGLVRAYLKQKDVEQAEQAAEKGLAQSDSPRIRAARAEVWFREGKITEAEKEWVEIINSGYPEARAYLGLARVRNAIAMYKSASAMIVKAHELDSRDPDIQEEWVQTLSRGERINYLRNALAGENNWSADEREAVNTYLEFLTTQTKQKRSPCRLVSKVTTTETPLLRLLVDPQHLRGYGLPVSLNGHKSSLMLDTGASGILVKRSIAEHAGISKITATKVWGIGSKGARNAFIGIADSIKIGELEFQNCPVEVMESRSVADEDGLIGADVFENFLVELDFPNEKLKLSQLPKRPGEMEQKLALKSEDDDPDDSDAAEPGTESNSDAGNGEKTASASGPQDRYIAPEMQSYTRLYRFGHYLLVPTSIGKVPPKLFLIDSGSLTNFISPAAAREVTKVSGNYDTIVEGVSGRVDKLFNANKATLQFGHLRQENQDMTAFDTTSLSDSAGTEISGFLGFTTLRFLDIKIDYRDVLVDFSYDRKRWGQ